MKALYWSESSWTGVELEGGVLDADGAVVVARVGEVAQVPLGPPELEARPHRVKAAAIERRLTSLGERARLRLDVDDSRRPESVLGGKGAGDELHALDEPRVELEAEARDALGQEDVVDAVLQVGVLAAHVEVAVRRGILRDPGGAQEHLAERGIGPLGNVEDLGLVHHERGGAQAGLDRGAGFVQLVGHDVGVELRDGRARVGRGGGLREGRGRRGPDE